MPAASATNAGDRAAVNPEAAKLAGYPLLDWLRFVLASIVALGHEGVPPVGPIDGDLAVAVFLALSGWLIGGILLRTGPSELPRFYFNRATRIWLPYLLAVVLVYGLAAARDGIDTHWFKYLFYDVTFTHYVFTVLPRAKFEMPLAGTGNHFWSLSLEELFYLVAPLFMFLVPAGKKLLPWVAALALMLVFRERGAMIAGGVIAAILQRDHGDWHLQRWARIAVPLAAVASLAALWIWHIFAAKMLFSALLVLALAIPGRRGGIGQFAGAISYPFYLNHWIGTFVAHAVLKRLPLPGAIEIPLAYAVAVAAGIATWWAVDRWVMERRGGWYSPQLGRALAFTAYALALIGLAGGTAIRLAGG